ncbi:MAG: FadR family transcriptional regulator [Kyrpidia tusciae]|nr:FadR/GntR family transcriptional regulator [Kyrpidia tusciae]MBE3551462.1 FadR family transcriptional regulator [Kyrpidia tusciae]
MIQPVRRSKLSEAVVEQLKELIQSGVYPPGTKLPPEKELAKQFGVSRASVREALSVLASAGIIDVRQGEGSFVLEADLSRYIPPVAVSMIAFPKQILHLLEMRSILETSAAELAARRAGEPEMAGIERAMQGYLEELRAGRVGDAGDLQFHQAVAKATGNPILVELMTRISDLIREGMRYTLGQNQGHLKRMREVYDEHDRIYRAIREHRPEEARAAMAFHLGKVREKVQREMNLKPPKDGQTHEGLQGPGPGAGEPESVATPFPSGEESGR